MEIEEKYQALTQEIILNGNLSEADRLLFYELHTRVKNPNEEILADLLVEHRNLKMFNPRFILSERERREIFKLLELKRSRQGLNRFEYRYFCFLAWKYNLKTEAICPAIPEVVDVTLKEFELRFSTGNTRSHLIAILKDALKKCAELYSLTHIEILVGGSFVDTKENPGDIDVALLLDEYSFARDLKGVKSDSIMKMFKDADDSNLIDLLKLQIPFNNDHYMFYEILTLLGNDPKVKTRSKDKSEVKTNEFRVRKIYRIKVEASKL